MIEMNNNIETDYLIVGSGAVGMAFADVLLTESDVDIVIIDRFGKPGGHWNVAYPFVTLHQPSAFYGVSSVELSKGLKDDVGLNKGLNDLATGDEILAYYDHVLRHHFLPSGRVKYFPMHDYIGDGKATSMINGDIREVKVRKKIVDCTYLKTSVPATHTPNFSVDQQVNFVPINDLVKLTQAPDHYVIIGGGKTGIDACLWLLEQRVDPDKISWVISRDAWLLDRQNTQPTAEFFDRSMGAQANQFEAVALSTSIEDMFDRLEAAGVLVRIDESVRPTMFHGATISQLELVALRRLKNLVRLGRVKHIGVDGVQFERGSQHFGENTVYVDCSASAISNLEMKPIFEQGLITPQTVRSYQPVFSAALIAHIELSQEETNKNQLCQVVPLPNHDTDWIRMMVTFMTNQFNWNQDKQIRKWLYNNRLDGFSKLVADSDKEDPEIKAILSKMKYNVMPAMMKLQQYVGEIKK